MKSKTQEEIAAMKSFPVMFTEMWRRKAYFLFDAEAKHKDSAYTIEDMDKAFNKGVQTICALLSDASMAELPIVLEECDDED